LHLGSYDPVSKTGGSTINYRDMYTMTVATWLGNSSGRRAKEEVASMADPTPSVILSSTQKRMNTQPDGMSAVNLGV